MKNTFGKYLQSEDKASWEMQYRNGDWNILYDRLEEDRYKMIIDLLIKVG